MITYSQEDIKKAKFYTDRFKILKIKSDFAEKKMRAIAEPSYERAFYWRGLEVFTEEILKKYDNGEIKIEKIQEMIDDYEYLKLNKQILISTDSFLQLRYKILLRKIKINKLNKI